MTHSNTLLPFIVENGDQISILSHYLGVGEGIGRRASVCIGARFRVHRGALPCASGRASVRVEARFGTRRGALQVRVEARCRYASRRASGTRRAQKAYESEFKTWKRRASGALFRPGGWTRKFWCSWTKDEMDASFRKESKPFPSPNSFSRGRPSLFSAFPCLQCRFCSLLSLLISFSFSLSLSSSIYFFPFYELQHKCHLFLIPHYCDLLAK